MSAQRRQDLPDTRHLSELLADANQQLLERDAAVLEILAVRDQEVAQANERFRLAELELERAVKRLTWFEGEVASLNRALSEIQASRVWRLAERYRQVRDRFKAVLPSRPA